MIITSKKIPHNYRNRYLKNTSTGGFISNNNGGGGNSGLPYTFDENGDYIIDRKVTFKGNVLSTGEVCAYAEDGAQYEAVYSPLIHMHSISEVDNLQSILDSISGGTGTAISIVDNLISTDSNTALSANQGRVLKGLIDNKSSVSSWDELLNKPSTFPPSTHTHNENYYTKGQVDNQLSGKSDTTHSHDDLKRLWNCYITIGSWSRLCYATNINLGGSFLLSINYTRNSVVVNNTFLIAFGHRGNASITTLSPYNFSQIQLRLTTINENDFFIELLDTNVNIESTQQHIRCSAGKIDCNLTTYTEYTASDETTITQAQTQTEAGRIKLDNETIAFLTDNIASASKLQIQRTINGVNFDGTAAIETAYWGATRNISIQDASESYTGSPTRINGSGDAYLRLPNSIVCNEWFRSTGNSGWFNNTYGGGIYMNDDNFIRVFGDKKFHVTNSEHDSINSYGGLYSNGNNGHGLTINGSEATTTRIKGQIGSNVFDIISSYETQWYSNYARIDIHRGGGTDISKFSWKYNNTEIAYLKTDGNFVINGNILATGEITAYSDKRLKSNIKKLTNRGKLNPITYIKDNKESIGFIAQEVQEIYPELVIEEQTENKYLSLNYNQLTAVLASQINELTDTVNDLIKQINELKNK